MQSFSDVWTDSVLLNILLILFILIIAGAIVFGSAAVTMIAWNIALVSMFKFPPLTIWTALCINILIGTIGGAFRSFSK